MNNKLMWSLLAAGAAGIAFYLVKRRRKSGTLDGATSATPEQQRTKAFVKAKSYANGEFES